MYRNSGTYEPEHSGTVNKFQRWTNRTDAKADRLLEKSNNRVDHSTKSEPEYSSYVYAKNRTTGRTGAGTQRNISKTIQEIKKLSISRQLNDILFKSYYVLSEQFIFLFQQLQLCISFNINLFFSLSEGVNSF